MAIERWGSLSVRDHLDTADLVANVLLYDRLVMPVMSSHDERDERAYWIAQGWDPDLQRKRLDQLEELAICRPWNAERRAMFKTRLELLNAEREDARHIDAFAMTRAMLALEPIKEKLADVDHVEVIAAYNSAAAATQDFGIAPAGANLSQQALLLTRRLALPALDDAEDNLRLAMELSRDKSFRAKRAALFEWQEQMVEKGLAPEAAVGLLVKLTDQYNEAVEAAKVKLGWKLAFTLFKAGLGFATGGLLGAGASAALSLVQFATLDGKLAIEPGTAAPAAMFHDIEAKFGLPLTGGPPH
ncbi:hypothetical protein [Roseateles violae]|uniref:Uncharacterized protein n=1 Tax=Roseateles violae TaxID=3058042 RepID=A0ABT8DLR3_9BURK|nr:hypothetical protein [Pelomonas sp. PFR6]MDN3918843.1 hypothetical protein [Pelomonas sp. PFR6]